MNDNYRTRFFRTYEKTHAVYLDANEQAKRDWFKRYIQKNYLQHIESTDKAVKILELGCNKGYLLHALAQFGFKNLWGVDLSPEDVKKAVELVPDANIACIDAVDFLPRHTCTFHVIIMKATIEHIEKKNISDLLTSVRDSLAPGGRIIIDVPNMDWLFATHERYMDFTHELGFTKESLRQVMSNFFDDVTVTPVDNIIDTSFIRKVRKKFSRFLITTLLKWADPEGASNPIWSRSIVGVGKK